MHVTQNFKQKSIARKTTILLAALTLSTAVATNALAAGHGGGGGGGGGLGGGGGGGGAHIGGGFGGGHVGGGLGGGGFASGHIGVGSAGGRMIGGRMGGDHPGGHGEVFLGNPGGSDFHGTRMGGDLHYRDHDHDGDHDHDRHHHFRERFVGVPGYYYDDYGYGLDDYASDKRAFSIGTFTPPPAGSGVRSGFATELAGERTEELTWICVQEGHDAYDQHLTEWRLRGFSKPHGWPCSAQAW
jgi:hypothetical protein